MTTSVEYMLTVIGQRETMRAERDALASTVTRQRSEIDTLRAENERLSRDFDAAREAIDRWRARVDAARNDPGAGMLVWQNFIRDYLRWAVETFPEGTAESGAKHLAKEIAELLASGSPEEMADCFMLLLFIAHKKGLDATLLLAAAQRKFKINKTRTWGEPNEQGFREHVK